MKYLFFLFAICTGVITYSQEKRIALVIGNSNYKDGFLKNPVNDALLMKETLEGLDFDVLMDTNIATISQFNEAVRHFGEKRGQYNVGFIYYAGHGVQINDINYLLATKEEYKSAYDVEDKALSIQKIMRFLTSQTDEVNVLILDACRDNPFEQNWNPKARSAEGGKGLAKIITPMGSLIAYSTESGQTAEDGEDKNSIYAISLSRNLKVKDITLEQVFKNVRQEVANLSNRRQIPVEESKLVGGEIIFNSSLDLEVSSLYETIQFIEQSDLNKRNDILKYVIDYKDFHFKYSDANDLRIHYINQLIETNKENPKFILHTDFSIDSDYSNEEFYSILSDSSNLLILSLMKGLNSNFDNNYYNSSIQKVNTLYRDVRVYIALQELNKDSCFLNIPCAKMIKEISEIKSLTEDRSLFIDINQTFLDSKLAWDGKNIFQGTADESFQLSTNNIHSHYYSLQQQKFIDSKISLLERIKSVQFNISPQNKVDSTALFMNKNWSSQVTSQLELSILQDCGSTIDSLSFCKYLNNYLDILNHLVLCPDFENNNSLNDLTYYHFPLTFSLFQLLGATTYHYGFSSEQQTMVLKHFEKHLENIDSFYRYVLINYKKITKKEFRNFTNNGDIFLLMNLNGTFVNELRSYLVNNDSEKYMNVKYAKELHQYWLSEKLYYEEILKFAARKEPIMKDGKFSVYNCDDWVAFGSLQEFSAGLHLADRLRLLNYNFKLDSNFQSIHSYLPKRDQILENILNESIAPYFSIFYERFPNDINWFPQLDFALWFDFFQNIFETNKTCNDNEYIFTLFYLEFITNSNIKLPNTIDFHYIEQCLEKLILCKDFFRNDFKTTLNYFLIKAKEHISDYYGEEELNNFTRCVDMIVQF
jgi:hypothetical protein